jgi:acyl-coenzyme A thioesterase PaaI-like protein
MRRLYVTYWSHVKAGARRVTGTVLHRGRRLAIGASEVHHGGKRVAVVTGTTALSDPGLPG